MAAVNMRNAVMLREALVQEGVVGIQQIGDAAIFAQDALEKELGLLAKCLTEIVVKIDETSEIRRDRLQGPEVQPLTREIRHEAARAGVGEHPAHLGLEKLRLPQITMRGGVEQRVIRQAAPEKKRQT